MDMELQLDYALLIQTRDEGDLGATITLDLIWSQAIPQARSEIKADDSAGISLDGRASHPDLSRRKNLAFSDLSCGPSDRAVHAHDDVSEKSRKLSEKE